MSTKETLLELQDLSVHYGGVKALDGVSISLGEGEIVALMGPNGAGKSTALKSIFGLAPIHSGKVLWHGKPIKPTAYEVVERGVAFVPQGRRVFVHMSVEENLEMGAYTVRDRKIVKERMTEVMEIFPVLREKKDQKAGTLSGGEQQMLAIGRGLMADPKVLLLDEPSLGLAPKIVKEVFIKIREINERHKTAILVVEHNIKSLLDIVHRGYVLDKGRVVTEGSAQEILESKILERVFVAA